MRYTILGLAGVLGLAAPAGAQFPGAQGNPGQPLTPVNPNNFMPNIFNPANQPLSPYLNLLRGGNPAANYYYGVRPGTVAGNRPGFGGQMAGGGGNRPLFFPQLAAAPDPLGTFNPAAGDVLAPAGHPAVFNNTMGYFPGAFGQAGGAVTGVSGLGASRAPGRR